MSELVLRTWDGMPVSAAAAADAVGICVCGHFEKAHEDGECRPSKHACTCSRTRIVALAGRDRQGRFPSGRLLMFLTKRDKEGLMPRLPRKDAAKAGVSGADGEAWWGDHAFSKGLVRLWLHGCELRMVPGVGCEYDGAGVETRVGHGVTVCEPGIGLRFGAGGLEFLPYVGPDGRDVLVCPAHMRAMREAVFEERKRLDAPELHGGDLGPVERLGDTRPGAPGFKGF